MKRILTTCFTAILFLLLWHDRVQAQKLDSMINAYGESFPQEKIHIHFDKPVYNPGEPSGSKPIRMQVYSLLP